MLRCFRSNLKLDCPTCSGWLRHSGDRHGAELNFEKRCFSSFHVSKGIPDPRPAPLLGVLAADWVSGIVRRCTVDGVLVDVCPPHVGSPSLGYVSNPAKYFAPNENVHVRIIGLRTPPADNDVVSEAAEAEFELSMRGDEASMKSDVEAQLAALQLWSKRQSACGVEASMRQSTFESDLLEQQTLSSMLDKPLPAQPDVEVFASESGWIRGYVHHHASFGIYVVVPAPDGHSFAWGIVHLNEMPSSVEYKRKSEIRVRIRDVDVVRKELRLTMLP